MEYKMEIVIQKDEYNSISEDYKIVENVSSVVIDYSIESVERFKKKINIFDQLPDKDKATHLMSILEQVCEENDINITELLASELGYKQYKDDEHYIKSND